MRLTGWKSKFLSLAGRHTLVKSVLTTMLNYVMQTSLLPISVCNSLDKLSRNFLWGDTDCTRKTHLVNWKTMCLSEKKRGLGIRNTVATNMATVSKLGWKIMKNNHSLWVEVLRKKYKSGNHPRDWKKCKITPTSGGIF